MSYVTSPILKKHGITAEELDNLSQKKQDELLIEAVKMEINLGDAYTWLKDMVQEFQTGRRDKGQPHLSKSEDPNSTLGGHIIRLCAFDMPRAVMERHFGITIGMYNCCRVILANSQEDLHMTVSQQLKLQQTADC